MPFEILNSVRAKSVIRVTGGAANTQINLNQLSAQTDETVTDATIAQVSATTNGIYRIYRGTSTSGGAAPASGTLIMEITSPVNFVFYEYDITLANNSTSNVFIEHTGTAGTLIMQLSKGATYSPALTGM